MFKLEPNVNGMKKEKSQLNFFLISKKKLLVGKVEINEKEICDQRKTIDQIKIFLKEICNCHKGKSFKNPSVFIMLTSLNKTATQVFLHFSVSFMSLDTYIIEIITYKYLYICLLSTCESCFFEEYGAHIYKIYNIYNI